MCIRDRCKCVKPPRTHHCSKCDRCVLRMDHHCKWMANCVGHRNLKFFLNFGFYMALLCLYSAIVFTVGGLQCAFQKDSSTRSFCVHDSSSLLRFYLRAIGTFCVGVLALLVSAFCMCQIGNQLHLIKQNRSFIDNLQRRKDNFQIEKAIH